MPTKNRDVFAARSRHISGYCLLPLTIAILSLTQTFQSYEINRYRIIRAKTQTIQSFDCHETDCLSNDCFTFPG